MKHSISSHDPQFHPCYVSSTLRPMLRSTVFRDEELLRVVGLFRVTLKMNFFFRRRRRARFAERNPRRETVVSILHKPKLRKSPMDMEKKHCGESKKPREKERSVNVKMQQHLVIAREHKSEIPSEKGVVERRRRRREREERNCEHVQNGTLRYYFT